VGWKLALGIILLPIIFAWFTLRPGYSILARTVSLTWTAFYIFSSWINPVEPPRQQTGSSASALSSPVINERQGHKSKRPSQGQTYVAKLENQKSRVTGVLIVEEDLNTETSLALESDLIDILARRYHEGADLPLAADQVTQRNAYGTWLSNVQQARFPQLRAAYGKILNDRMWKHDIEVQVLGADQSEVLIYGAPLIRNAAKHAYLEAIMPSIHRYRFRKVTMRWRRRGEGTEWTFESPDDRAVLVLEQGSWKEP